ncbi:MAG: hypothetical protein FWF34_02640 [Alphaproteobacteria bacterium]|nr:hypothetical protein [Alphaproteobacteria bacterium]MCL2890129.1 hypothetical protein [Alphaproteobacteria bacterium]
MGQPTIAHLQKQTLAAQFCDMVTAEYPNLSMTDKYELASAVAAAFTGINPKDIIKNHIRDNAGRSVVKKIRRGTRVQHENFTGAMGEITMDTDDKTLRVHDGETLGGTPLARLSDISSAAGGDNEQIAEQIAAGLAGKANKNLDNIDGHIDVVIASHRATDGSSWFRRYKSGWVDQGGIFTSTGTNAATITLPVEMADINYATQATMTAPAATWSNRVLCVIRTSAAQISVHNAGGSGNQGICWQVSGQSA